ncbi:dephospho-CoA kinase [Ghiorsea bivora]|uniref:dephospho-CoA kinase n=1 Tax=Ghiorsea bivora TaxID=1485545 RepID=UPI00056F28F9|nr:dephospho-CoA kinase [Ghiorsea bivora]
MTLFYGLTGGIGAGKSTVAKMFADWGVPTLDLDEVGKILLDEPQVQQQLVDAFGLEILQDNKINRDQLRTIAFQSKQNTKALNGIMHPTIRKAEMIWREKQNAPFAIIEASVLIESGDINRMSGLIVVLTNIGIRKQRVLARGKQDSSMFTAILQKQCSDEQRKQMADYTIHNNSDLQALRQQVDILYKQLQQTT